MSENRIRIGVTRAAVWEVLADGWSYTNWVTGTSHMRAVSADWPAVGSRLHHCSGAWPVATRDQTEVETCEPGHRLTLHAFGRPLGSARIHIELADDGDGCVVVLREAPVSGPGLLGRNPLGEAVLRRRNTESLARLAALAERRTDPE